MDYLPEYFEERFVSQFRYGKVVPIRGLLRESFELIHDLAERQRQAFLSCNEYVKHRGTQPYPTSNVNNQPVLKLQRE